MTDKSVAATTTAPTSRRSGAQKGTQSASSPGAQPLPGIYDPGDGFAPFTFETDAASPFKDKYSIEKEQVIVGYLDHVTEEQLRRDKKWQRWELLQERKEWLIKALSEYKGHKAAEVGVSFADVSKMDRLGTLVNDDEAPDTMELHTKEAFRLFMGRRRDPEGNIPPIPGAKRVGAVLRMCHNLSRNDNPYADWALLLAAESIKELSGILTARSKHDVEVLRQLQEKGLRFGILQSKEPKTLDIGFKSPYGYLLAEFVVDFDYYVRVLKTMIRKARMTDLEGREAVRAVTRPARAFFEEMTKFERFLFRAELQPLTRSDYLPNADANAKKRVEAVTAIFGPVPAAIFEGTMVPPYTQRRAPQTDADRSMLARIAMELDAEAKDEEQNPEANANKGSAEADLL